MFVKILTTDKEKSSGITLPADKKFVKFDKTTRMGYLGFKCAAVTAGTYLYVNLTGTDVKSYTAAKSLTVTAEKRGAILTNPTLTITADAAGSTVAMTKVKAKCPSFGDSWVHWAPKAMGAQTLFAGVNETTTAFKAYKKKDFTGKKMYN